jgi:hypothetical protein
MRGFSLFLALIVPLPACETVAESKGPTLYPQSWPALLRSKAGQCSQLTGRFEYFGEKATQNDLGVPRLDAMVFNKAPTVRGLPQYVSLWHSGDRENLRVKIEGAKLSPPNLVEYNVKVECQNDSNIISFFSEGKSEATRVSSSSRKILAIASDGSLVVRSFVNTTATDLMIISRSRSGDNWYRFKPVDQAR